MDFQPFEGFPSCLHLPTSGVPIARPALRPLFFFHVFETERHQCWPRLWPELGKIPDDFSSSKRPLPPDIPELGNLDFFLFFFRINPFLIRARKSPLTILCETYIVQLTPTSLFPSLVLKPLCPHQALHIRLLVTFAQPPPPPPKPIFPCAPWDMRDLVNSCDVFLIDISHIAIPKTSPISLLYAHKLLP